MLYSREGRVRTTRAERVMSVSSSSPGSDEADECQSGREDEERYQGTSVFYSRVVEREGGESAKRERIGVVSITYSGAE